MGKSKGSMRPVWCTIYSRVEGYGCWHVEWGHDDGPGLSAEIVERLSRSYYRNHKSNHRLANGPITIWNCSYDNRRPGDGTSEFFSFCMEDPPR